LNSALAALGPEQVMELLAAEGVRTKVEPGGKVFPESDKALDVLAALLARLKRSGCATAFEEPLVGLEVAGDGFRLTTPQRVFGAGKVILTTGGQSYPGCGTTGDGYRWATSLGHTVVSPRPALVPLRTDLAWVTQMQGITVPEVELKVVERESEPSAGAGKKRRPMAEARGSLLFTHFGLSGPVTLDVSRAVSGHAQSEKLRVVCDFLPQMPVKQWDAWIAAQRAEGGKRQLGSLFAELLPRRLADTLVEQAGMSLQQRLAELSNTQEQRLFQAARQQAIVITGTLGFRKAEVTAGGVALEEIDSRTLESKRVPGLDLDGPIGGYNFQAAFSTGFLAGESV
jgi:predicted Rossmann fold flavoprotein